MEDSEVAGKLLEVKLAPHMVLAERVIAVVVEIEPMTVAVAVEDMVQSLRIHTSLCLCCA